MSTTDTTSSDNDDARIEMTSYTTRDINAMNNEYMGEYQELNNELVKIGAKHYYITEQGVAREVKGGVTSDWSLPGKDKANNDYVQFTEVPNANCPESVTDLTNYSTIDDIQIKDTDESIYEGNPITSYHLTACGAEGKLVYINTFMEFEPVKIGGENKFYIGNGIHFRFLDRWRTQDWETVAPIACKLATESGYKTVKLEISYIGRNTPVVNCFVSNVDYSVNLTRQKGFSDYYTTSQGGNLVTANRRNCNPNVVKRFNKIKTNYEIKNKPGYENGTKEYDYSSSLFHPTKRKTINSSDILNGLPIDGVSLDEEDNIIPGTGVNDNKVQKQQYYLVKNKPKKVKITVPVPVTDTSTDDSTTDDSTTDDTTTDASTTDSEPKMVTKYKTVLTWNNRPMPTPCSEYKPFTQNYLVRCNNMSDYPGYSREKPGWTQRIPRGMRKCNALYKVWHTTIPNFNVYVGNVGYVSSVGIMNHLSNNMLTYDDSYDTLRTFTNKRVCRNSRQYLSNRKQIMGTYTYSSIDEAKEACANNAECAGFEMLGTRATFFLKANISCGHRVRTLNSMLPLTEDPYQSYVTVWKSLVMTDIDLQGSCPTTIYSGYYGQLWYAYTKNGYTVVNSNDFECSYIQPDTKEKQDYYLYDTLPAKNKHIATKVMPQAAASTKESSDYQAKTSTGITEEGFTVKEGLTLNERKYGNVLVDYMNKPIPYTVEYDNNEYDINDKDTLYAYSIIQGDLSQGLITARDADLQLEALLVESFTNNNMGDNNMEGFSNTSGGLVSIFDILNQDYNIIAVKNAYHYVVWIMVALGIGMVIVLIAFSIIPALNSKGVLKPLTIGLGVLSMVLIVMKYNLLPLILEFLNYFLYYQ